MVDYPKTHMRWQNDPDIERLNVPACGMHGNIHMAETWDRVTCQRCLTKPHRGPKTPE